MDSLVSALSSPARIPLHLGDLLVGGSGAELANRRLCAAPVTLRHGRADPGATPPTAPPCSPPLGSSCRPPVPFEPAGQRFPHAASPGSLRPVPAPAPGRGLPLLSPAWAPRPLGDPPPALPRVKRSPPFSLPVTQRQVPNLESRDYGLHHINPEHRATKTGGDSRITFITNPPRVVGPGSAAAPAGGRRALLRGRAGRRRRGPAPTPPSLPRGAARGPALSFARAPARRPPGDPRRAATWPAATASCWRTRGKW